MVGRGYANLTLAVVLVMVIMVCVCQAEEQTGALKARIRSNLRRSAQTFDFLGTISGGAIHDSDVSDAFTTVGNAFEDLGKETAHWATGAYSDTQSGFTNFLNDAKNGLTSVANDINNDVIKPTDDFTRDRIKYFQDGSFVNDMKDIADEVKDALTDVCKYPGAQMAMKFVCSKALQAGMCAVTSGAACGGPKTLAETLSTAGGTFVFRQAAKCGSLELLKLFADGKLCSGVLDWLSDEVAIAAISGGSFDGACNAAIECMCGTCPTSCSYENRMMCGAAWWLVTGGSMADSQSSHRNTPVTNTSSLQTRTMNVALKSVDNNKYLSIDTNKPARVHAMLDTYTATTDGTSKSTFQLTTDATGAGVFQSQDKKLTFLVGFFGSVLAMPAASVPSDIASNILQVVSPNIITIQNSVWHVFANVDANQFLIAQSNQPDHAGKFQLVQLTKGVLNDARGGLSILKIAIGRNESTATDYTMLTVQAMIKNKLLKSPSVLYKTVAGTLACQCGAAYPVSQVPFQCEKTVMVKKCFGFVCIPIPQIILNVQNNTCPPFTMYVRYIRNSGPEKLFTLGPSNDWNFDFSFTTASLI